MIAAIDRHDRGEIAARAVAADRELARIAAVFADMVAHPLRRDFGVVDRCREPVFRRQAIADVDDDRTGLIGDARGMGVMGIEAADDPAAAMEINHRARRVPALRTDDADRNLAARARDGCVDDRADLDLGDRVELPAHELGAGAALGAGGRGIEAGNSRGFPLAVDFLQVGIEHWGILFHVPKQIICGRSAAFGLPRNNALSVIASPGEAIPSRRERPVPRRLAPGPDTMRVASGRMASPRLATTDYQSTDPPHDAGLTRTRSITIDWPGFGASMSLVAK